MIKQILLSSFGGILVTVLLLATPSSQAACQGFCADKQLENGCQRSYAGCNINYDANDNPVNADCFYVGDCELEAEG